MDIKQILDNELKRRKDDDILAGSRMMPAYSPSSVMPADYFGSFDSAKISDDAGGKIMRHSASSFLPSAPSAAYSVGGSLMQGLGLPASERVGFQYISADGTTIQMSANYAHGNKAQAVGALMNAAYGAIMGTGYSGAKASEAYKSSNVGSYSAGKGGKVGKS